MSSENEMAPFKKDLQQAMEKNQITLEQLYNCDETGLYFRSLPAKTLAAQSEKQAAGMKKQKDRVTLTLMLQEPQISINVCGQGCQPKVF